MAAVALFVLNDMSDVVVRGLTTKTGARLSDNFG